MLRVERLRMATERLAAMIESVPAERLREALPDELRMVEAAARRVGRVDLVARLRTTAIDSLRRLPDRVERSPADSNAWFQHLLAIVAWLDGQTDRVPPLLESERAIASQSSAVPGQEKLPFSDA